MALQPPSKANDYYPKREHFPTQEQFDAHVQTLKQLYAIRDLVQSHAQEIKSTRSDIGQIKNQPRPGGPLNTTLNGIIVKAGQPANGDTVRYSAATGEFTFGA